MQPHESTDTQHNMNAWTLIDKDRPPTVKAYFPTYVISWTYHISLAIHDITMKSCTATQTAIGTQSEVKISRF